MMMRDEMFYKLALSKTDGIGPVKYKKLVEQFGSAREVFHQKARQLKMGNAGLSTANIHAILHFKNFDLIEKEINFCSKNAIQILDASDKNYPERLKQCVDAPAVLFYKGNGDLNQTKIISIIGTRLYTEYGKKVCEELIEGLKPYDVMVCSGLAFGIDAIAHKNCLRMGIPTIGVVAHGLDVIYPSAHKVLAKEMLEQGGLLSEYFTGTNPDKGNFPTRNRIVAGMSDATVVIETDLKGGSMITAEMAYSYNRDVFCYPGRVTDSKSNGCNFLIKSLKAQMVCSAEDIANNMSWSTPVKKKQAQRVLFVELSASEQIVMDFLKSNESVHIDEFYAATSLNSSDLAASLLNLEMQGIVKVLPGKRVVLVD